MTIRLGLQIPNFSYGRPVAELFPAVKAQAVEAEAAGFGTVGDCYDNAAMESFWGRLQVELLNNRKWLITSITSTTSNAVTATSVTSAQRV
jgi:hypothetical protein